MVFWELNINLMKYHTLRGPSEEQKDLIICLRKLNFDYCSTDPLDRISFSLNTVEIRRQIQFHFICIARKIYTFRFSDEV